MKEILIVCMIFPLLFSCQENKEDTLPNDVGDLSGSWNLVRYVGGMVTPMDVSVSAHSVNLTFEKLKVTVESTEEYEFRFDSGEYPYAVLENNDQKILLINGEEFGYLEFQNKGITVDYLAADGFLYYFEKLCMD